MYRVRSRTIGAVPTGSSSGASSGFKPDVWIRSCGKSWRDPVTHVAPYGSYVGHHLTAPVLPQGFTGQSVVESITDEYPNVSGPRGKRKWNYCLHTRTSQYQAPHSFVAQEANPRYSTFTAGPSGWYFMTNVVTGVRMLVPSLGSLSLPAVTVSQISAARADCWNQMEPNFSSGFSGLNFIWELKDFKRLASLFLKMGPTLNNMRRARYSVGSAPFKSYSKTYLAWKFGVESFIRDLKTMEEIHRNINNRLQDFNQQGSVRNVHHSTKVISELNTVSATHDSYYRTLRRTRATFKAQAELQYCQWFGSKWDQFWAVYGLSLTPEAFWDAIPFSFVVDYFMSVGSFLDAVGRARPTKVEITQYSESITLEDTMVKFIGGFTDAYTIPWVSAGVGVEDYGISFGSGLPVASAQRYSYTRTPGIVFAQYPLPEVKFPLFDQLTNLVALIASGTKHK